MKRLIAAVLSALMMMVFFAGCNARDKASDIASDLEDEITSSISSALPSEPDVPSEPEMPSQPESTSPTMSTDTQIGTLDATKKGWGPGTNVDADNRPTGATAYQEKYGKYNADFIAPKSQNIYLTFDEGYENGYTAKILDVLKDKQVPAVFFVTQDYVKRNPDLVKRMISEGHIVGNHSWTHPSMPDVTLAQAKEEVTKLHDYVKEEFGYTMTLFRYPMGEFNEQTLAMIQNLGYRSVFWSFAYKDWDAKNQPDPTEAYNRIMKYCHGGAIYLLHAVSSTNTEILPKVIDSIRDKGYTFCSYNL